MIWWRDMKWVAWTSKALSTHESHWRILEVFIFKNYMLKIFEAIQHFWLQVLICPLVANAKLMNENGGKKFDITLLEVGWKLTSSIMVSTRLLFRLMHSPSQIISVLQKGHRDTTKGLYICAFHYFIISCHHMGILEIHVMIEPCCAIINQGTKYMCHFIIPSHYMGILEIQVLL